MNNDGWGQGGAGYDDMRVAGHDLQHAKQFSNEKIGKIHKQHKKIGKEDEGPREETVSWHGPFRKVRKPRA